MQLHWHTEPFLLISLLATCWAYALLTGPFNDRWARSHPTRVSWARQIPFYAAILLLYLAVGSPLDQLAEDYLFFMHMIQHMLLIYVVPPLLFMGIPGELIDSVFKHPLLRQPMRLLTHPVFAGLTFSIVYTVWHIPLLYEAALQVKWIHILEHATMLVTAIFMWWPFLSKSHSALPVSGYGVRILYAFLLMVAQLPVFAFLSFSNVAIYETYVWAPRIIEGLDPLNDQVLGGIIMKVTNMTVSLTLISWCFYQWAQRDEQNAVA
jgi:putative membrane protein